MHSIETDDIIITTYNKGKRDKRRKKIATGSWKPRIGSGWRRQKLVTKYQSNEVMKRNQNMSHIH